MTIQIPLKRFTVLGNSMLPTLKPGQDILIFSWFINPKAGDIVAIKMGGKEIIKRIQSLDDRLIFVMGDNEKMSTDSRHFGPIKKEEIIGQVIWY
ncbi:MAG: S26 family signal peptidase [Candidatus Daviesbacteria bacterium]|nr:MAG: S26 family signal peptidase [Candidatus Daviesbacteria bacterium]